jgi:hypothetical protein
VSFFSYSASRGIDTLAQIKHKKHHKITKYAIISKGAKSANRGQNIGSPLSRCGSVTFEEKQLLTVF